MMSFTLRTLLALSRLHSDFPIERMEVGVHSAVPWVIYAVAILPLEDFKVSVSFSGMKEIP